MLPAKIVQDGTSKGRAVAPELGASVSDGPTSASSEPKQLGSVVVARDASYVAHAYRSFEFATFEAAAGQAVALVSTTLEPARDAALAVAGLVHPTAGSLTVLGVELAASDARRLWRRAAEPLPRGAVGVGAFKGLLDVDEMQTVEEAVASETALRGASAEEAEILDYLAELGLATNVDQHVCQLDPAARARLSLALACAGSVSVAVCDLDDPFVGGLSAADACVVAKAAQAFATRHGVCVVLASREPAVTDVVPAFALDLDSADALAAHGASEASAGRSVQSSANAHEDAGASGTRVIGDPAMRSGHEGGDAR